MILAEAAFRETLLKSTIPTTDHEFAAWVAARWPQPRPTLDEASAMTILGLSDSFGTTGGPENYHYRLEEMPNRQGVAVRVVNFSQPGYGLPEELELLRRFGGRYRPHLVLHGFFVGNDVWPEFALVRCEGFKFALPVHYRSAPLTQFFFLEWLKEKSLSDQSFRRRVQETKHHESVGYFDRQSFLEMERKRLEACSLSDGPSEHRWERVSQALDALRETARQLGALYVMVIHPDQYQIEEGLQRELKETFHLQFDRYDLNLPQRFLAQYCETRGVPYLDLTPHFRSRGAQGGLYQFRETHYTAEGHLLAAGLISNFLQVRGLLKTATSAETPGAAKAVASSD